MKEKLILSSLILNSIDYIKKLDQAYLKKGSDDILTQLKEVHFYFIPQKSKVVRSFGMRISLSYAL